MRSKKNYKNNQNEKEFLFKFNYKQPQRMDTICQGKKETQSKVLFDYDELENALESSAS